MNYTKQYDKLIEDARTNPFEGYTEKHHVIPRCLGGSDKQENLCRLSGRQHYLAHLLLTKMYDVGTNEYNRVVHAFMMMRSNSRKLKRNVKNSRAFERLRLINSKIRSDAMMGEKNPSYGTMWIYNDILRESKRVPKNDDLPDGWKKGAKFDWDKVTRESERREVTCKWAEKRLAKIRGYYEIYSKHGWNIFIEKTEYPYTRMNLLWSFHKYIPEFVPKRGERRNREKIESRVMKIREYHDIYIEVGFARFVEITGCNWTHKSLCNQLRKHVSGFVSDMRNRK